MKQVDKSRFSVEDIISAEKPKSDIVELEGKLFSARVSYYVDKKQKLLLKETNIKTKKGLALPPFLYTKPEGFILNPTETEEVIMRYGYYPLLIVRGSFKGPNHWHRNNDEAMFCAVKNSSGIWETRYFPRSGVEDDIWREAERICRENEDY